MAVNRMTIVKSLEQLFLLGALTDDYKLSDPIGHQMARLPLDPIYSKALILANEFKCLEEMLIVVSMLSVESIFYFPREKMEEVWMHNKLQLIGHISCLFNFLSMNGKTISPWKKNNLLHALQSLSILLVGGINEVKFLLCLHIQIKYYSKQTICWFSFNIYERAL